MLQGISVVELAVWVAGPSAGGVLADWGADVVKVEPPAGDPMRELFGALGGGSLAGSPPFDLDNRGKRSVVLDLAVPEARQALDRLLGGADVFLTNLRPAALERLGLGPEAVGSRHPRLVYAAVSGYGPAGPDRDRAGYDVGAFWARTGIARTLVPEGEDPPGIRSGFGDHVTGITTVAGILAALLDRTRTGTGRVVETSLLRTGIWCLGWDLGIQLRYGKLAPTLPRTEAAAPLVNSYRAGDGRWFWLLGLEADRHWPGVVAAVDRPDLAADPRFADARARRKNAPALIAELDRAFAGRTRGEWVERFDANDVWWAPVQTAEEVVRDPQALAAGAFVEIPPADRDGRAVSAVASPVSFRGVDTGPSGPVPALGAATEEVLRQVGYDDAGLDALRRSGALG
ncbi:MAG: CoA transferase [Acidimicrobiales bacterium]|nr:CoA transferase [Acidimicrobiales bacterium]